VKTPAQLEADIAAALAKRGAKEKGKPWLRAQRLQREKARSITDDQLRELRTWAQALQKTSGGYSKGLSIALDVAIALGEQRAYGGDSREGVRAKCADTYAKEVLSKRTEP
jgi:hypothetical protein